MVNQRNISIEKVMLSVFSAAIMLIAVFCWGQIIVNAPEEQMIRQQSTDSDAMQSIKSNFVIFSGAVVVLARHLSSDDNSK